MEVSYCCLVNDVDFFFFLLLCVWSLGGRLYADRGDWVGSVAFLDWISPLVGLLWSPAVCLGSALGCGCVSAASFLGGFGLLGARSPSEVPCGSLWGVVGFVWGVCCWVTVCRGWFLAIWSGRPDQARAVVGSPLVGLRGFGGGCGGGFWVGGARILGGGVGVVGVGVCGGWGGWGVWVNEKNISHIQRSSKRERQDRGVFYVFFGGWCGECVWPLLSQRDKGAGPHVRSKE